jgi:hypothetical protein
MGFKSSTSSIGNSIYKKEAFSSYQVPSLIKHGQRAIEDELIAERSLEDDEQARP